jgi:ABC-type antimicrobial peptide transport system permease subunit
MNAHPPKLFVRFFRWFCHPKLHKYIEGDLMEFYSAQVKRSGKRKADWLFAIDVLLLFRPAIIRPSNPHSINNFAMLKNYFTIGIRNIMRHKGYAAINIGGLALGMAVAITIGLWIWDELSYNKNFERYATIAQVIQNVTNNGEVETWDNIPYPLAEELRKNYGNNFRQVVLTTGVNNHLLATENKKLGRGGIYAEPSFPELFSLTMVKGTRNALLDQSTALISASTAQAYFGDADPIGQLMTIDQEINIHVGGVYEDIPEQSTFAGIHFIAPWDLLYSETPWIKSMTDPWRPNAFMLYVELNDHVTFSGASASIKDAKLKKVNETLAKKKPELFLNPMSNWHLYSEFRNGKQAGGRIQYVWMFGIVGVFVMLMACINFMNLSTARSERRAKEVGIRKTVGSVRSQLIYQFLSESILTAFLSLLIALVLVQLMLPVFNRIAEKHVVFPWSNPFIWFIGIGFCIIIGFISGSYPALYLSSIRIGSVIKGVAKVGKSASLPRKVLVVIQFTVSIVLIIGTAIVFQQIQFAKNRPIGYSTTGLVSVLAVGSGMHDHFDAIKTQLVNQGTIVSMAEAGAPTTESSGSTSQLTWSGKDPDLSVDFSFISGSYDYGETIAWNLLQGRSFSRDFPSDSSAILLNQAAVKYMGLKNPIGEIVHWSGTPCRVIGVVSDIITRSPYEPVRPTLYYLNTTASGFMIFRINPETSTVESLAAIEEQFKKYNSEEPFSYNFTDEQYARKFGNEERVGKLAGIFASLAIFISCLGIFGLSSFIAEQRGKEIGIRKVLGASMISLWTIVSREFIILIILSCILAIPVAYHFLSSWLEAYHYHIDIAWWVLAVVSGGTMAITLLTVSWHTLYAASRNPVKSLRSE